MKLTWFASSTFRLHVGGRIIVTDPAGAPAAVAPHELTSGADTILTLGDNALPRFDPALWSRRRPPRPIDAEGEASVILGHFGETGLLVDAQGENLLILCREDAVWGRFADDSVVILFGDLADMPARLDALARAARPHLVAIASAAIEHKSFVALARAGDGTPLQVMEPGLALEV